MQKAHRLALHGLKLIGIVLFLWIVSHIDRTQIFAHIRNADLFLLIPSFVLLFGIYGVKTLRWHILVKKTRLQPTLGESWRLYNIGIFLGMITPAKIGEFGRAAYLKSAGLPALRALGITLLDRSIDVIKITILSMIGLGILFGAQWFFLGTIVFLVMGMMGWTFFHSKYVPEQTRTILRETILTPSTCSLLITLTLLNWFLYFTWTILIARSIGITVPILTLLATFAITSIIAILPIAPSGLGTRDAALLTLLAPFGVDPSHAIALASLMFVSIVLSSGLGGWYWMRDRMVAK